MDGYTFMIERNRVLIGHEERASRQKAQGHSRPAERELEAELRRVVLDLYQGLEGCGRSGVSQGSQDR